METKNIFETKALPLLPSAMAAAYNAGQITLVDEVIYFTKDLKSNTSVDMVLASDVQSTGLTNVNAGKLEQGNYMLLTGVRLRTATITAGGNVAEADFSGQLNKNVANGEIEINVSGKPILPRMSNGRFVTGTTAKWNNYFALDCPKLIVPSAPIDAKLYLSAGCAGLVAARLELHGVMTVRA
ncbi:MAG: hypothetical protein LBU90_10235 [Bacteroidales bacterium]|jgi:hypothetical protein|nr:hypothetical protein [Bacteroidales bacterium]